MRGAYLASMTRGRFETGLGERGGFMTTRVVDVAEVMGVLRVMIGW